MTAPATSAEFDRVYGYPITPWGDVRIPPEIAALIRDSAPESSLELGCGVGRNTRYAAQQGLRATGVDFSPVAIADARQRVARDAPKPEFLVGDVTHLDALTGPFDVSFDVGCHHCLDPDGRRAYASELFRLLRPGGTHLMWALDDSPAGLPMSPETVKETFAAGFVLRDARPSRRRLVRSHWYWLVRSSG